MRRQERRSALPAVDPVNSVNLTMLRTSREGVDNGIAVRRASAASGQSRTATSLVPYLRLSYISACKRTSFHAMNNDDQPSGGSPWIKSLLIWGGIFLALLMVVSMFGGRGDAAGAIPYSDFRDKVTNGQVSEVQVGQDRIVGKYKNGDRFSTVPIPNDTTLPTLLQQNEVKYAGKQPEETNLLVVILVQALPFVLILGIAFFALRQVQKGGGSGAMGFGKSKAKLLTER